MTVTNKQKSILFGVLASFALGLFYLIIMFLTMPSAKEVWVNFVQFWYFIIILVIGFGVQIGFWFFLKNCSKEHSGGVISGASGTASGGAMLACCAHHLVDILPIVGFSGAAIFLAQYQKTFLVLGVAINLFGVAYMLNLYEKHLRYSKQNKEQCH